MKTKRNHGFTLIELVLVIALLGILAAAALPKLFSISTTTARENARSATLGAVQAGISTYAADQVSQGLALTYPATLDSRAVDATSGNATPFFGNVIQGGSTMKGWTKKSETCFHFDNGGTTEYYVYSSTAGTFINQVAACP